MNHRNLIVVSMHFRDRVVRKTGERAAENEAFLLLPPPLRRLRLLLFFLAFFGHRILSLSAIYWPALGGGNSVRREVMGKP